MGPPMNLPGVMRADVLGWIDDLSAEEVEGIDDWIAQMKTLVEGGGFRSFTSYVVMPAVEVDRLAARCVYRRFSCVGFVAEAYAEGAGVRLVDETSLPEIDRPALEDVWGRQTARGMEFAGLAGTGPWRVLLPGYLLRAVTLSRSALPYRPKTPADAELQTPAAAEPE